MFKRALGVALICLHVIPFDSYAASSADIDALVADSQNQAQATTQLRIQENQQLIQEITDLEHQIQELREDIAINRKDAKRDLYIAGGSAIATILTLRYFGRSTGSEFGDQLRLVFGFVAGYAGLGTTVVAAGASGVNYLLVRVDERRLPTLQARLTQLKAKLIAQNEALLK